MTISCSRSGEKLTDDEVDALLTGVEDGQGQVNYEGLTIVYIGVLYLEYHALPSLHMQNL